MCVFAHLCIHVGIVRVYVLAFYAYMYCMSTIVQVHANITAIEEKIATRTATNLQEQKRERKRRE